MKEPSEHSRRTMHGKRVKSVLLTAMLFVVSCVAAIAFAEAGGRFVVYGSLAKSDYASHLELMRPHATRGWSLVPNSFTQVVKRDYRTGVRINSKGLRDREHEYAKKAGTYRILILGDSFMEAQQVKLEESFPAIFQSKLAGQDIEVINSGVNGYSNAQELVYLEEEGKRYEPDLVLLSFFTMNDIIENYRPLLAFALKPDDRLLFSRPFLEWDDATQTFRRIAPDFNRAVATAESEREAQIEKARSIRFYQRSIFYELYDDARFKQEHQSALARNVANIWIGMYLDDYAPLVKLTHAPANTNFGAMFASAWQTTDHIVLEMKRVAESGGAKFAIMLVPAKQQVERDHAAAIQSVVGDTKLDFRKPNAHVLQFATESHIPLCDPLDTFVQMNERGEGPLFFNWDDNHWTSKGHKLFAQCILDFVARERLLRATS